MMRVRWYGLHTKLEASEIAGQLKSLPYTDDSRDGFLVDHLRADFVQGSLVQRLQTFHETIDPFGHAEKYEVVEYVRSRFRLSPKTSSLELTDPGRVGNRLVSRLSEALGFAFSIEEISVDPLAWASNFRETVGIYGSIERVQIGSVAVGNGAVGQVLVKGSGDVAEAAIQFVAPAEYKLEKVQLKFRSARGSISFQRNAAVVLSSSVEDEWMEALRHSLQESTNTAAFT
ncbi:hypothetical protein [Rhizobium ruizarguesonis]|uniref:hypothetical protein n=2 Tax=Rhizobium TaxID=379 RepID=UPI00371E1DE4